MKVAGGDTGHGRSPGLVSHQPQFNKRKFNAIVGIVTNNAIAKT